MLVALLTTLKSVRDLNPYSARTIQARSYQLKLTDFGGRYGIRTRLSSCLQDRCPPPADPSPRLERLCSPPHF